jgi:predicted RNA-binding Zn-ribbon protein involved in translation (DUF1610 family)
MAKEYTHAEWLAEGKRIFGEDFNQWKFVCPMCGHVQTIQDFRDLHARGYDVTPDTARFNCYGRYVPAEGRRSAFIDGKETIKSPCDYTSGGLFICSPVVVIDDAGTRHSSFDFYRGSNEDHA